MNLKKRILVQVGERFSKKLKQETHVIILMSKILPYAKEMRRFLYIPGGRWISDPSTASMQFPEANNLGMVLRSDLGYGCHPVSLKISRIHYGKDVNQPDFMGWNVLGSLVNLGMFILLMGIYFCHCCW